MNNEIASNKYHHQSVRQTVYGRNTYNYAPTPVRSGNEGKPVVASRINLPLETDGPATCLVYFFNS